MKNFKRIALLSSILAAALAASACDDSVSDKVIDDTKDCVENALKCEDNTLLICTDGQYVTQEVCGEDKVCAVDACVDKNAPQCDHSNYKATCIDDKTLKVCTKDDKLSTEICANGCKDGACVVLEEACTTASHPTTCVDENTIAVCNEETGKVEETDCQYGCADNACLDKCSPNEDLPYCVDGKLYSCNDDSGKMEADVCPHGCYQGQCLDEVVVKECVPECTDGLVCNDGECVEAVAETPIGGPCSCTGDDCHIVVTGKELKGITGLLDIPNDANVIAPNFFATGIKGCEDVVAPEGMTVGCFRTETITFDQRIVDKISDLLKAFKKMPLVGNLIDLPEGIEETLKTLLGEGIAFSSPKGYCLTSAIDIHSKLDRLVGLIIDEKNLNAVAGKIATGDHATAIASACPTGTSKFSYTINEKVDKFGSFDVGFDLCLKTCISKDDCRDGYDCIEIPDGVPAEGQTTDDLVKKNVCFDKSNVDYFVGLTSLFSPAPVE